VAASTPPPSRTPQTYSSAQYLAALYCTSKLAVDSTGSIQHCGGVTERSLSLLQQVSFVLYSSSGSTRVRPKPSSQENVAWLLVHHAGFTGAARRHLVGLVDVSSNGMSWKPRARLEEGLLTGSGALSNHAPGAEARPRPRSFAWVHRL
jgi:hypothetical protein